MIKIAIPIVLFSGLVMTGHWYVAANANYDAASNNYDTTLISSFADCVAAGNPILESYPEQCKTADGQTFVNATPIADEDIPPTMPVGTDDDTKATAIAAVRAFAATDLNVDPATIDIVAANEQEWPDGCLGLGGPDEMCIMMITFGYEVILTAENQTVVYRTDQTGAVVKNEQTI